MKEGGIEKPARLQGCGRAMCVIYTHFARQKSRGLKKKTAWKNGALQQNGATFIVCAEGDLRVSCCRTEPCFACRPLFNLPPSLDFFV